MRVNSVIRFILQWLAKSAIFFALYVSLSLIGWGDLRLSYTIGLSLLVGLSMAATGSTVRKVGRNIMVTMHGEEKVKKYEQQAGRH